MEKAKVKILQFGEGNFLRGYFDWMVERMNARADFGAMVQVVQPRAAELSAASAAIRRAGGAYYVMIRGIEEGKPVERIERVGSLCGVWTAAEWSRVEELARSEDLRFVVSNTTEAGIVYRKGEDAFPNKVMRLLRARFKAGRKGLVFLPCELVENNGGALKECVFRYAVDAGETALSRWIERECIFCSTLVDRIVPGPPDEGTRRRAALEYGIRDEAMVVAEPYHFLAVECPEDATGGRYDLESEMPLARSGVNVVYTRNLEPYRTRKVRFLNGAHTGIALAGRLAGFEYVHQLVEDAGFAGRLKRMLFDEIAPTLDLPGEEKSAYALSVLERFANPFANHRLLSIALNSVSKWRVRILPTVLDNVRSGRGLPPLLAASMASLIRFYRTEEANDTVEVMEFFRGKPDAGAILANAALWGMDLNGIAGFADRVKAELGE